MLTVKTSALRNAIKLFRIVHDHSRFWIAFKENVLAFKTVEPSNSNLGHREFP